MFPERDHIHTVLYEYLWDVGRDADGVPVELALEHPYQAMHVLIGERNDDVDMGDVDAWFKDKLPGALAGTKIGQVAAFKAMPLLDDAPPDVPRDPATNRRFMQMWFAEDASGFDVVQSVAKEFDGSGLGSIVFASPFKTTIPGTDTYTDQLW
jgi:hypothetical protein